MPIHNVENTELEKEIELLQKAGKEILYILPDLIHHAPGHMFGKVIRFLIVFR